MILVFYMRDYTLSTIWESGVWLPAGTTRQPPKCEVRTDFQTPACFLEMNHKYKWISFFARGNKKLRFLKSQFLKSQKTPVKKALVIQFYFCDSFRLELGTHPNTLSWFLFLRTLLDLGSGIDQRHMGTSWILVITGLFSLQNRQILGNLYDLAVF